MTPRPDPYATLGVSRSASDAEVRAAYRRLVLLHHPDHNGGSAESARRFEAVQDAYAEVRRLRQAPGGGDRVRARPASSSSGAPSDPGVEARLAAMERELRAARAAREQAIRDARAVQQQAMRDVREAAAAARAHDPERPSDEELGYVTTDDSLSKIIDDAVSGLGERLSEARESPAAKRLGEQLSEARESAAGRRVSELIDDLASKLTGEPPEH